MRSLLNRYFANLIVPPLVTTLLISAMILLLIRMTELLSFVISEGGDVSTAFEVLGNLVPQYLAFGVPIGLLLGVLRAYRGLALNNELDAVAGVGLSKSYLLRVPLAFATGLALLTIAIVGFIQPLSVYEFERLLFNVRNGVFGFSVPANEMRQLSDDITIRVRQIQNDGHELSDVFLAISEPNGTLNIILAKHATLTSEKSGPMSTAKLFDGSYTRLNKSTGETDRLKFDAYDLPFELPNMPVFRTRGINERELMLNEQLKIMVDPNLTASERDHAAAGVYRRLAQTLVLFFLPFLAIAMAQPGTRSRSELGGIAALVMYVVYNEISLYGERLGFNGQAPPLPVQLAPFLVFGIICISLFLFAARYGNESPSNVIRAFFRGRFGSSTP